LICHEKWVYDDRKTIALLAGFEMHCGFCDMVTHIGRTMQVQDREVAALAAVEHLRKVNKCDVNEALEILTNAMDLWEKRNRKRWKIRVAPELLESYPELAGLPEFNYPAPF